MSGTDRVGNYRDYLGLGQLHIAMRRKQHKKFLQHIIEKQRDINYQIPATDFLQRHKPELVGCTALHLALSEDNFEAFNLLLKYRSDFNVKNHEQMNILRRSIEEKFNRSEKIKLRDRFGEYGENFTTDEINGFVVMQRVIVGENFNKHDNWRLWGKFEDRYVNSILSTCLEIKNVPKYPNDKGVTLFHAACLTNNTKAVDFFIKNGADVYQPSFSPILKGFTPLHFAVKYSSVETLKILLANQVNCFNRESGFISPVDLLVDQNLKIVEWLHANNKLPYKNSILDSIENEEKLNVLINKNFGADWTGFSSFHVACTLRDPSSVEVSCQVRGPLTLNKFLERDQWHVYDRVSSIPTNYLWSGYTALHFAAFFNIETAKLLTQNGADIEAKNKYGVTPLDILETRATIDDLHFMVLHKESWKCIVLSDKKTRLLDLLSTMSDLSTFKSFLNGIDINLHIPNDSPLWPGCTILHLVVTFSETVRKVIFLKNISESNTSDSSVEYINCCKRWETSYLERIKICLEKSADVTIKDARGWTPINLAFRQRNMKAVNIMLHNHDKIVNPTDDDNLSHLNIACYVENQSLIEKLLAHGADVNVAVKSSFKWQSDYHRCTSIDVFDLIGSTPLHLIVSSGNVDLVKVLLKHGADANAVDASGLTPLQRIFILQHVWDMGNQFFNEFTDAFPRGRVTFMPNYSESIMKFRSIARELLFSPNLKEPTADDFVLSNLHVAVHQSDVEAVKKLLDTGSDINSVIKCPKNLEATHPLVSLSSYDGCTPLHMTHDRYDPELRKLLLESGADFLIKRPDCTNAFFVELQQSNRENISFLVEALKKDESLRRRLQEEFGWTLLHLACHLLDVDLALFALSIGVDVNSRTNNLTMYPGSTALRVLMVNRYKAREEGIRAFETIFSALLDSGADVALGDTRGDTALHRSDYGGVRRDEPTYADRLLRQLKSFNTNPINHEGVSLFHIACVVNNVDVVSKFLQHDVDANRAVDPFADYLFGRAPLHLAVSFGTKVSERQLRIVELLLKRGVDVDAEDVNGDTPLHVLCRYDSTRDRIFEVLFRYGANVNAKNIFGETPLESLLKATRISGRELEFFLERGCRLHAFNEVTRVGYLSMLIRHCRETMDNDVWKVALTCPSMREVDCKGRTVVHNLVSTTDDVHDGLLGYFMDQGCDINRQDESGSTALHLAARIHNADAVERLTTHGCDVNAIDFNGKTAFDHALSEASYDLSDLAYANRRRAVVSFMRIFHHVTVRNLRVNEVNERAVNEFARDLVDIERSYERLRKVRIGETALIVDDFLSETKAIVYYSKISPKDRRDIDQFFASNVEFRDWRFLCELQYRKALQRAELVENAKSPLNVLAKVSLPELCYDVVEKFLSNADLKNLILASNL